MANKKNRIATLIQKNISDIIQFQMKNPNIGFITVTDSRVNDDNSLAKIYVSFLGVPDSLNRLEELKKAKGFIRTELAKRMDIYKVPELVFILDDTYEKAQHLEELLAKEEKTLSKNSKKKAEDGKK